MASKRPQVRQGGGSRQGKRPPVSGDGRAWFNPELDVQQGAAPRALHRSNLLRLLRECALQGQWARGAQVLLAIHGLGKEHKYFPFAELGRASFFGGELLHKYLLAQQQAASTRTRAAMRSLDSSWLRYLHALKREQLKDDCLRRGKGSQEMQSPGKRAVTLEMVAQLVRQGSWPQAFDTLEEQLMLHPDDPNLHSAAATIALHQWLMSVHDNEHLFDAATTNTMMRHSVQMNGLGPIPAHQLRRNRHHGSSMLPPPPRLPRRHIGDEEQEEGQAAASLSDQHVPTVTGQSHPELRLPARRNEAGEERAAIVRLLKGQESDKIFHWWHLLGQRLSACTIPGPTQHFVEMAFKHLMKARDSMPGRTDLVILYTRLLLVSEGYAAAASEITEEFNALVEHCPIHDGTHGPAFDAERADMCSVVCAWYHELGADDEESNHVHAMATACQAFYDPSRVDVAISVVTFWRHKYIETYLVAKVLASVIDINTELPIAIWLAFAECLADLQADEAGHLWQGREWWKETHFRAHSLPQETHIDRAAEGKESMALTEHQQCLLLKAFVAVRLSASQNVVYARQVFDLLAGEEVLHLTDSSIAALMTRVHELEEEEAEGS